MGWQWCRQCHARSKTGGITDPTASRLFAPAAADPKPLDLGRLVTGMSDLLRRTLGEQITVETVLSGGVWRAHADPNQLELAIINLAVNARDAMPNGGKLTLETANVHLDEQYAARQAEVVPGQYVMLAITDTGTGMTPEVKAKAFDPFFTTKDIGHGTGLGLSKSTGSLSNHAAM